MPIKKRGGRKAVTVILPNKLIPTKPYKSIKRLITYWCALAYHPNQQIEEWMIGDKFEQHDYGYDR